MVAAAPVDEKRASGLFAAVPEPSGAASVKAAGALGKPSTDSGLFGAIGAEPAARRGRRAAWRPRSRAPPPRRRSI